MSSAASEPTLYPSAPWQLNGQLWVSLFRLREPVDRMRPAGIYGAAFVSYEEGSPLTYSELLVARPVAKDGGRRVQITDIWVDSPASVAGGRALWAIPKGLGDFTVDSSHAGPVSSTAWSASLDRRPIAEAHFRDASRAAPRLPFKARTWQPAIDDHTAPASALMRGSAKSLPCLAHWSFDPDGPLGWLHGHRTIASFRMSGFRMSFG